MAGIGEGAYAIGMNASWQASDEAAVQVSHEGSIAIAKSLGRHARRDRTRSPHDGGDGHGGAESYVAHVADHDKDFAVLLRHNRIVPPHCVAGL